MQAASGLVRHTALSFVTLGVAVYALAADLPTSMPGAAATANYGGTWETTYGVMVLRQEATGAVTGTYDDGAATIAGTVTGSRLNFTYEEPNVTGKGWFELAEDGLSFSGQWRPSNSRDWGDWKGKRPRAASPANSFVGLWRTRYGPMRLVSDGSRLTGVYKYAGVSSIHGTVEGRRFTFDYEQPDGERGSGAFDLAEDGKRFTGTWKTEPRGIFEKLFGRRAGGQWDGTRIEPQPGRSWLVILEAHWESSLAEQEYSYGEMLRSFFERTPRVMVRHRFVQDEADLRRWCEELAFLPEPIVLYISSHGSPQGVMIGPDVVGADALIECLRFAGDVRLLHFGACSVMDGPIPAKLTQAMGGRSFPISGFTLPADWAGSAIVDFCYMDLVLERRMDPAEAAEQVRRMITFACEQRTPETVIGPMGLTVYDSAAKQERASR